MYKFNIGQHVKFKSNYSFGWNDSMDKIHRENLNKIFTVESKMKSVLRKPVEYIKLKEIPYTWFDSRRFRLEPVVSLDEKLFEM